MTNDEIISIQTIPKRELKAFYQKVGQTIAEWLASLECPNCKADSDLDWMLKRYSDRPMLLCRHCGKTYPIKGLRFKRVTIGPCTEELIVKNFGELQKALGNKE